MGWLEGKTMGKDYIALEEAVVYTGLHPDTLTRMAREGRLEAFKATYEGRRRWLFSRRALRRFLDEAVLFEASRLGPKMFLVRGDVKRKT
jgi:excisionase family DNA binding protein